MSTNSSFQNTPFIIQKDELLSMLRYLNKNLMKKFIYFKDQFSKSQVPNNQISNVFKSWKPAFDQIMTNSFSTMTSVPNNIDHKYFLVNITQIYSHDQEYIEVIKNLNSTTEMIKQFIRMNAIRDPTTHV